MAAVCSNDAARVAFPDSLVEPADAPRNPLLEGEAHDYTLLGAVSGVRAEPAALHFERIAPGERQVQRIRLINTSGNAVRMHIHSPSTPFFSMGVEKRGSVLPGLAEEVTIAFTPTDLRYYHDAVRVHTPGGNLLVPLHACAPAPCQRAPERPTPRRRPLPLPAPAPRRTPGMQCIARASL